MSNKIDELYFGVKVWDSSHKALRTINLFDSIRVQRSVASYIKRKKDAFIDDPLAYCFGDVWGRAEWEFMVSSLWVEPGEATKVDVYEMYVKPNAGHLMDLVNSVSEAEAKRWLAEDNKRRKGDK